MQIDENIIKDIINDIENKIPINIVAKKYHKKQAVIKRALFELGGEKGKEILLSELEKKLPIIEIVAKYKSGSVILELAEEYKIAYNKILNSIGEYELITGEKILDKSRQNRKQPKEIDKKEITQKYFQGMTYKQIGDEYHVAPSTIRSKIQSYMQEQKGKLEIENSNNDRKIGINTEVYEFDTALSSNKQLKVVTKHSLKRILSRYDYTYEELSKLAYKSGHIIPKEVFEEVLNSIKKDDNERDE